MGSEERAVDEGQLTEEQTRYILESKFRFLWRITYADGKVIDQLDSAGREQKIDFFSPASRVEWISLYPGQQSAKLDIPPGCVFKLWRNVINKMDGVSFIGAYILGYDEPQVDGSLKENWYYISPLRKILVRKVQDGGKPTLEEMTFDQQLEGPETKDFKYAMWRWWEKNSHLVAGME